LCVFQLVQDESGRTYSEADGEYVHLCINAVNFFVL